LDAGEPAIVVLKFGMKAPQKRVRDLPTTKPDIDKQVRTCLDAITQAGNVWADDCQVVVITASKYYDSSPHTIIEVRHAGVS
jgi:Holliday junction resolvase RusA-like endonuclease